MWDSTIGGYGGMEVVGDDEPGGPVHSLKTLLRQWRERLAPDVEYVVVMKPAGGQIYTFGHGDEETTKKMILGAAVQLKALSALPPEMDPLKDMEYAQVGRRRLPVLMAIRRGDKLVVACPACKDIHMHKETGLVDAGCRKGPLKKTGYIIRERVLDEPVDADSP